MSLARHLKTARTFFLRYIFFTRITVPPLTWEKLLYEAIDMFMHEVCMAKQQRRVIEIVSIYKVVHNFLKPNCAIEYAFDIVNNN